MWGNAVNALLYSVCMLVAFASLAHADSSANGAPHDFVDVLIDAARPAGYARASGPSVRSSWTWASCGDGAVTIDHISTVPERPVKGQNLTIIGEGYTDVLIENGTYADVDVRLGFLKVFSRRLDVCAELVANNVSLQCPIAPGFHRVEHTVLLPHDIPPARFGVQVESFSSKDEPLACIRMVVSFSPFSWIAAAWRSAVAAVLS
ncbi:hypothetical protein MCUN1_000750 [Malassezia cuniculi]|uniref:Phosphatidylglycerol/phosphatidylinositol transfer protein n=1 Tax=Malassezia cuniculi TaxID=948313 RepID=A0AAF0ERY8_9BASI|nr:hypothetical protein MCUN1_000750 [Malassezia cuniculi]